MKINLPDAKNITACSIYIRLYHSVLKTALITLQNQHQIPSINKVKNHSSIHF